MHILKKFAALLPVKMQYELKRVHYGRQIKKNSFRSIEPEYEILSQLISPGDWVIDIGANVGHYTKRFSELVGQHGRVIAFEPVPETFSLLAANVQLFSYANVTLINAAVSNKQEQIGMTTPYFCNGLINYYQARLTSSENSKFSVIALTLDSLCIDKKISLVKIDTEGHESFVLAGMQEILKIYQPALIVETESTEIIKNLSKYGYSANKLSDSPNLLFITNT